MIAITLNMSFNLTVHKTNQHTATAKALLLHVVFAHCPVQTKVVPAIIVTGHSPHARSRISHRLTATTPKAGHGRPYLTAGTLESS